MKIVVFGPDRRVGALVGETVVDLNRAFARLQSPGAADTQVPAQLAALIERGDAGIADAQRAIDFAANVGVDGVVGFRAADVKLHAPWPGKRIACVGGNFGQHLWGMEGDPNVTVDEVARKAKERGQWGFWKVLDTVAGPDDDVPAPRRSPYFDYEAEPAVIIGKRGKNISGSEIDSYVWGVTLANDWSIRESIGPARPMSYNQPKNFDMSMSLGPCIVVGETRYDDIPIQLSINGAVRQSFNSEEMIFSFGEVLEYLSYDFTFVPGDVISGGTNAGTAQDSTKRVPGEARSLDLFLKVGDVVEVSSPKIGVLRNRIVAQ